MSPPPGNCQENDVALGAQALAVPWEDDTVRVTKACTACGACLATCPERALLRAPKRPMVLDAAYTGCWACIEICPAGAIVEHRLPSRLAPSPVTT